MDQDDRMAELQQKLIDENRMHHNNGQDEKSQASFQINEDEDQDLTAFNQTEKRQIATLADLPPNTNLDDFIQPKEDQYKPFSSRIKLIVEYNEHLKRYEMSQKDQTVLEDYQISYDDFQNTTRQIEANPNLRPFDRNSPFIRRFGLRSMTFLVCIIYAYVALLILQLALFNLILLGIIYIYLQKVYYFMHGIEFKQDYNYKNSPLRRFIEAENQRFYRSKHVELIGGEMGKWLELQLPDAIEDFQKNQKIENSFDKNLVIHERDDEDDQ